MKTDITKIDTEELISELQNRGYIRVLWHTDDIISQAENMDVKLSESQVDTVADLIRDKFDAEIGVNWNVIRYIIEEVTS